MTARSRGGKRCCLIYRDVDDVLRQACDTRFVASERGIALGWKTYESRAVTCGSCMRTTAYKARANAVRQS